MNSVEVFIIVEGQTEQAFARSILAPYMAHMRIYLHPILIGNPGHKGGNVNFDRAKLDIEKLLKQRQDTYITTMFDYFRIDVNWPGKQKVKRRIQSGANLTAEDKAKILEEETLNKIIDLFSVYSAKNRFIPYIGMHEFEALLFSDPAILANKIDVNPSAINQIVSNFNNPEEINDDPVKAPSKRLENLTNNKYRKIIYGKIVTSAIGIDNIRDKCPHFNSWLKELEKLV